MFILLGKKTFPWKDICNAAFQNFVSLQEPMYQSGEISESISSSISAIKM